MTKFFNRKSGQKGFTLLELLIVIGIISVLVAVAIVAINPARQFAKVNDTRRIADLRQIASAIQQNIVDNKGPFSCAAGNIPACNPDGTGTVMGSGSGQYNICNCLVSTYLPQMPVDPQFGNYTNCTNYDTQYEICSASLVLRAPRAQLVSPSEITLTLPGQITVLIPPGVSDTVPPTVGSISPTSATVNAATTFSASVSDNVEITSCSLFIDGADQGLMNLSASPCTNCTTSRNHTFTSEGTFSMYGRCSDQAGNAANGTPVAISVTAPAIPDFSVSASPADLRAPQTSGTSDPSTTVTVTSLNNLNSSVSFSVRWCTGTTDTACTQTVPSGVTPSFSANPVTPPANGSINSTLSIDTNNTPASTYFFRVRGQSASLIRDTSVVTLTVVDLSVTLTANPSSGTAPLNGVDLTAAVSGSATGTINYKFDCTNDGVWELEVNNSTLNPFTVVDVCNYSTAGTFTAKVRVERDVANPAEATTIITVTAGFDFSVSASPSSGTVVRGSSISTTVTATLLSGITQSVSFSASGLPANSSAVFSPTSCSPSPTCSSTMTITTLGTNTLNLQVGASANDGYIATEGSFGNFFSSTDTLLKFGKDPPGFPPFVASSAYSSFARFTGVSGLAGAMINSATLTYSAGTGSATTKVRAERASSPTAPTTIADYQGRPRTTAGVDKNVWVSGTNTITITTVIQELANGFNPTAILILHENNGSVSGSVASVAAYDHTTSPEPRLDITYTPPSATPTGIFPITITGTSGALTRQTQYDLTVTP